MVALKNVTNLPYRGLGHNLDPQQPLTEQIKAHGMDWKPVPMPLLIKGKTENRLYDGMKALVRSDTGMPLGVATDEYKPFSTPDIVRVFDAAAGEGGAILRTIGEVDGGRTVWGTAELPGLNFSLPVSKDWADRMQTAHGGGTSWITEDTTRCKAVFSSGHVPGKAFTAYIMAERDICTNGAKISRRLASFTMSHRRTFTHADLAQIKAMLQEAGVVFEEYQRKASRMVSTQMNQEEAQAFVIQLLQPELFRKMVEENRISKNVLGAAAPHRNPLDFNGFNTGRLLEEVVSRRDALQLEPEMFRGPVRKALELLDTQPGAAMSPDTVWQGYNAITYMVDHVRGLNNDSGLNAALFGEGSQLKENALDLAMQYVDVLGRNVPGPGGLLDSIVGANN